MACSVQMKYIVIKAVFGCDFLGLFLFCSKGVYDDAVVVVLSQ